jgi:hypothetical protein
VTPGTPLAATLRRLLAELGERGRTGALHVGGGPGGVLYLIDGRIVYAETPACPGLGERLVASGRLTAQAWRSAYAEGRGSHRVGRVLLRDGRIGQNELCLRVMAVIADATHELLRQPGGPARFVPGERHWLGELPRMGFDRRLRAAPRPRRRRSRFATAGGRSADRSPPTGP